MAGESIKRKLLMNVLITALLTAGLSYGLYWFQGDLERRASDIALLRFTVKTRLSGIDNLADLRNTAPTAVKYQQALDQMLPTSDRLLDIPSWLDGLSRIHQVRVRSSFSGSQTAGTDSTPGSTGLTLDVSGDYARVLNFMRAVEINSRQFLVIIDKTELTKVTNGISLTARGTVYFK